MTLCFHFNNPSTIKQTNPNTPSQNEFLSLAADQSGKLCNDGALLQRLPSPGRVVEPALLGQNLMADVPPGNGQHHVDKRLRQLLQLRFLIIRLQGEELQVARVAGILLKLFPVFLFVAVEVGEAEVVGFFLVSVQVAQAGVQARAEQGELAPAVHAGGTGEG